MIEGERRSRTLWVFGLDGVSVALAIALAVLALKTLARQRGDRAAAVGGAGRVRGAGRARSAEPDLGGRDVAGGDRARRGRQRTDDGAGGARAGAASTARAALVDDLFAFAQAGARPLPGVTTSVAEVVEGVIEELRAPALERGITINVTPPVAPVAVRCASGVLASLLSNLLRNAIKHMGSSTRRQVDVRIEPRHDRVRFEVQDTGPGLPPELVPQRVRSVRARRRDRPSRAWAWAWRPCAGWSRATTAATASSSRPGEGALFWFELPAADELAAPRDAARSNRPAGRSSPGELRHASRPRTALLRGRKNGYVNFCWSSLNGGKRASFAACSTHRPVGVPANAGPTATDCTVPLPATT